MASTYSMKVILHLNHQTVGDRKCAYPLPLQTAARCIRRDGSPRRQRAGPVAGRLQPLPGGRHELSGPVRALSPPLLQAAARPARPERLRGLSSQAPAGRPHLQVDASQKKRS
jgi:hypothetical protein